MVMHMWCTHYIIALFSGPLSQLFNVACNKRHSCVQYLKSCKQLYHHSMHERWFFFFRDLVWMPYCGSLDSESYTPPDSDTYTPLCPDALKTHTLFLLFGPPDNIMGTSTTNNVHKYTRVHKVHDSVVRYDSRLLSLVPRLPELFNAPCFSACNIEKLRRGWEWGYSITIIWLPW